MIIGAYNEGSNIRKNNAVPEFTLSGANVGLWEFFKSFSQDLRPGLLVCRPFGTMAQAKACGYRIRKILLIS